MYQLFRKKHIPWN